MVCDIRGSGQDRLIFGGTGLKALLQWVIRSYQRFVSPALPPACRFHPSCSEYAWQAIDRYGAFKGSWLAAKRVLRCHPLNPGGYDPVP